MIFSFVQGFELQNFHLERIINPSDCEIAPQSCSAVLDRSLSRSEARLCAISFLSPAPSGYNGRSQRSLKATSTRAALFLRKLNLYSLSESFQSPAHFTGGRQLSARTASYSSALTTGPLIKQPETKKTSTLRLKSPSATLQNKKNLLESDLLAAGGW